jgi:imidazolonepropionase-like amidohydrolase
VAPGKRADLLVLNADPTADIRNLRELRMVILNGELVVDKR